MLETERAQHQRAIELMREIAAEAEGWDPQVRIEYEPSSGLAGGGAYKVALNVKRYRRHDRRRVERGSTPVEALERALATFRMVKVEE